MSFIEEHTITSASGRNHTEDLYNCRFIFKSGNQVSFTIGYWALKQCGLMSITGINHAGHADKPEWDEALQLVMNGGVGIYAEAGNFMFSVSTGTWNSAKNHPNRSLSSYLINHPNTRIIHQMRNNAHPSTFGEGGNHMLICMLHLYPEDVGYTTAQDYGTLDIRELRSNVKQT